VPAKIPFGAGVPITVQSLEKVRVVGEVTEESPLLAVTVPLKEILSALASLNNAQLIALVMRRAKIVFFMFIFLFLRVVVVIEAFL
jgi:hypothetical protein